MRKVTPISILIHFITVNGHWGRWGPFGNDVENPNKRFRHCDNPAPKGGGTGCPGNSEQGMI